MCAWLLIGLLASPDVATVERARELIRSARYDEALGALKPIADQPDRVLAMPAPERVVLYYALGRAHQELNQACAAQEAFDLALGQPGLPPAQQARIIARRAALAPALTGRLQVDCVGAAVIGNSPMPCGEVHTVRAGPHALTVSLPSGLAYPTETVDVPACLETSHRAPEPATLRFVGAATRVTVDDIAVELSGGATPVPPGEHQVRVERGEAIVIDRRVDFASGVETVLTPPAAPVAVAPRAADTTAFWAATTIGALSLAGAGTLAVFGFDAADQHADLQRQYDEGRAGTDFPSLRDRLTRQEDRANTFYLIAGGLAGAAVVSGVIALLVYPDDEGVRVGVGPGGVVFGGAF